MIQKLLATACLLSLTAGIASAEGDAEKGEKVFRKCRACHAVGEGAENKVGPQLNGIVGREIAALEGFGYSDALTELAVEKGAWTEEELAAFLEKPRDYAKGTKMSFARWRVTSVTLPMHRQCAQN